MFQSEIDFRMFCPVRIKAQKLSEIWSHFKKSLNVAFSDAAMVGQEETVQQDMSSNLFL